MRLIVVPQSLSRGSKTAPQATSQVVGIPEPSSQAAASSAQHASSRATSLDAVPHNEQLQLQLFRISGSLILAAAAAAAAAASAAAAVAAATHGTLA
jgi:hypothetical protein